ncbi:probable protein phosphatase 2C 55 [Physcomitrium patens]|uniref:Protein phosphatase n=1 Tax=Physcomitrium patens TaxID=3218 RepID=A0A2K1ICB8_PHYPA|nr:probable protein phosphatase 2C 71 [Physcomitrium patens]XP_024366810.1 probable protein phosphatase 2C 71 [Physcomitrium patens]XP_024366811.1 probable protein phosphatase 2C 71 [Physcomitrium patens]PNR26928.1 hypothetical protein PHYPA_030409 [Physcomitrium patens]|eukprot:XP_024366809.1 probable protein phosphatase 2C 71 [Physcomitrella patens]
MNNTCCNPTMSVVGVRAAALGSRGLLFCQSQCKFVLGIKGSSLPHYARSVLPHPHRPTQKSSRLPSLLTVKCASHDPFPPATTFVLLNTKECADGSIMFNFGSTEQQTSNAQSSETNIAEVNSSDSGDVKASVNISRNESVVGNSAAGAEDSSDIEDVPDAASLSDLVHGAEELAEELNKEDDELKAEASRIKEQRQSEIADKAGAKSNGSSNAVAPTSSDGSDSSDTGIKEGIPNHDVMFNSAAAMIPHPEKASIGGEDAYFIDGTRWVGVADGVGGWALSGVNAGDYARELMWNCAERARKVGSESDPKSVLIYAAKRTKSKGTAATLIASLYDQTLRVANVGDSGFVVVRDSTVVARSEPMIRGFNFPYQIGTDGDDPEMAEVYDIKVQKNDVVILGSDGIWDNLFEQQVIEIVDSVHTAGGGPEILAKQLVTMANKLGQRKQGMSPFAAAAHAAGYTSYFGGKLDDSTAVVAYVT